MTIQWGDTGKVAFGTLKKFTVSLATPRETLSGTPTALPSTNPTNTGAQAIFTIQQSDLPSYSFNPTSVIYTAILYIGGKNTDSASQTVNYQCYKNGVAVGGSGTQTVATNLFWTQSHFRFFNVQVGDTLAVSVWCSSANVNYDYVALQIIPTEPVIGKSYINKDVNYTLNTSSLSAGNPNFNGSGYTYIYPCGSGVANNGNTIMNFPALGWSSSYNAFRLDWGDATINSSLQTHASYRPYYLRVYYPSQITFREVLR